MILARTRAELAAALADARSGGRSLGLVPTMGFVHEGHLSLVDRALELCDAVVTSVFVNPLQFGPSEDLATYPRDEARDRALLEGRGAAVAFVPSEEEMYPGGEALVTVDPGPMEDRLCGAYRPGHFRGVLTVVAKLLGLVRPDVAVFGRKDFQQAVLIARMVHDLELGVRVETGPIVREPDGVAMSSRNAYLGERERAQAVGLSVALRGAAQAFEGGERDSGAILRVVHGSLADYPLLELQYAEVVDPSDLSAVEVAEVGTVVALAAYCGTTRLIDNVQLGGNV
jgi:pantoate--beta-alanine ligase